MSTLFGSLEIGALVAGDYRIVRPLGKGGFGAVYVVEQQSTGKERALKVMHPMLADDAALRERFENEARIAARIDSDHVVEVLAAGVDEESGAPWIAMELLHGRVLGRHLKKHGPLSGEELVLLFEQLCHALGEAHEVGIVHRDLKPPNIFIAKSKRPDVPFTLKVLDFGISKWIQDARTVSEGSAAVGSPLWMSPEQTKPKGEISPATDVWALGLIAFYLLTGRPFWESAKADMPVHAFLTEMLISPIPRASERARAFGIERELPEGFDAFFRRAVCRDRSLRFQNAREALAGLKAAFAGEDISVPGLDDEEISGLLSQSEDPSVPGEIADLPEVGTAEVGTAETVMASPPSPAPSRLPLAAGVVLLVALGAAGAGYLLSAEPPPPPLRSGEPGGEIAEPAPRPPGDPGAAASAGAATGTSAGAASDPAASASALASPCIGSWEGAAQGLRWTARIEAEDGDCGSLESLSRSEGRRSRSLRACRAEGEAIRFRVGEEEGRIVCRGEWATLYQGATLYQRGSSAHLRKQAPDD